MRQQVNLYTAELRPAKAPFDFSQVSWLALALLVLIGLAAMGVAWHAHVLAGRQAAIQQQIDVLQSQQSHLSEQVKQMHVNPQLQQSVDRLEQSIKQRQALVGRLHQVRSSNAQGFSSVLTALARQSLSKLWLTDIRLNGETGAITLTGRTIDPERVPQYLARLRNEPAFSGKAFAEFHMQQDPEKHGILDFVLASQTAQHLSEAGQ